MDADPADVLDRIVQRFERISSRRSDQGQSRLALAHEIDEFLRRFPHKPTSESRIVRAQIALDRCNLPLTKYIFGTETNIDYEREPKAALEISPSVAITVIAPKRKVKHSSVQFNSVDYDEITRLGSKVIHSLEDVRTGVSGIADRYDQRQRRKKAIQWICREYTD